MSSIIEDIKSRLSLADVAGGYIKLERAGVNYKARCPFHQERSASLFISPIRQTYHCFGCNKGGDIITFVEEIEGLDFQGALKLLADKAGVALVREKAGARSERESIFSAMEWATKFYEAVLPKFPEAEEYLRARGITSETIAQFRIGFAPDEWRALADFLAKKGIPENIMEKAGLIARSSNGFYDRFRGRIMFPIMDNSGRVIAFSGRVLKNEPGKTLGASVSAKYVNSPETEIFHKSRALFGLSKAKEAIRQEDACVLVEGQIDLVLSHQSGVTHTVATSGTALTLEHLLLIKRFTNNVIFAFDADSAGIAAAHRGVELALSSDMIVRIARLPKGMDPADLVQNDQAKWVHEVKNAKQVIDLYLELLPELHPDKNDLRKNISKIIIPFIALLKSPMDQGHYVGETAKILGMKDEPVWDEVKKYKGNTAGISDEHMKKDVPGELSDPLYVRIARALVGVLRWQEGLPDPTVKNIGHYRTQFEEAMQGLPPVEIKNEEAVIFEAEARLGGSERVEDEIKMLLGNLKREILHESFLLKMIELKRAEKSGDVKRAEELLNECQAISKKLANIDT